MTDIAGGVDFHIETDLTTAGTLADWNANVQDVRMPESWESASARGMASRPMKKTYGGSDATLNITFHAYPAVIKSVKARARNKAIDTDTFIIWGGPKAVGSDYERFKIAFDNVDTGAAEGGAADTFTVQCQVQGAITTGTVADATTPGP